MEKYFAWIDNGLVVNVVVAENVENARTFSQYECVEIPNYEEVPIYRGDYWDGSQFILSNHVSRADYIPPVPPA